MAPERWRSNWRAVARPGAVPVDVPRSAARRSEQQRRIRDLPPGTPVVLLASAPGAIGRCRTVAAEAGVAVEREYLAFPSAAAPAYLVEDAPATVGVFVTSVLVAPPGTALSTPIEAALGLLRVWHPWRLMRRIAPGRVAVGRRT